MFKLISDYLPAGDQITAIDNICTNIQNKVQNQTLLGVTGSGKTFTMANVIKNFNMPALIMSHNKILCAQLYEEFKNFFPHNAVEYFVSYYDYFRPESYNPSKGLFLEKESSINETIDQLRHKATRSVVERKDTIIISSVSCIYGIGSFERYSQAIIKIDIGYNISIANLNRKLVELSYNSCADLARGKIKVQGEYVWIGPSHVLDKVWRIKIVKNIVVEIHEIDPLNRKCLVKLENIVIYPNSHYVFPENSLSSVIFNIQKDLEEELKILNSQNKFAEAQRLQDRVLYDITQLKTHQSCAGIENYTRYLTNRLPGEHPPTLYEYFPRPFLLFVDESHVTLPQIEGMSKGDAGRKKSLVDYGFRLSSAKDNRPMTFEEWNNIRPYTIFVSATPGKFEKENSIIIPQIIRPTGLLDPTFEVKKTENQIEDAIIEAKNVIAKNNRVLMLTLTKKTAENLSEYLKQNGLKVAYLHGELTSLERIEKLYEFRNGTIDILVGVNLLREGIDVPECSLICIFEADFEGFLRTESALIQMIGRAARHLEGHVILYADKITESMKKALSETARRRELQNAHNVKNNVIPQKLNKKISEAFLPFLSKKNIANEYLNLKESERKKAIKLLEKELKKLVKEMNFEEAAKIRDKRNELINLELV